MPHRVRAVRPTMAVARPVRVPLGGGGDRARSANCRVAVSRGRKSRHLRLRRITSARRWRSRSKRAQVSAIATILGLLLVVSFVANYIATTLPSQMAVNDGNHALQVENQLGHLVSVLQQLTGPSTQQVPIIQPISLGSLGIPPFAGPDGASLKGVPGQTTSAISAGLYSTLFQGPPIHVNRTYSTACNATSYPLYNNWQCNGANSFVSWYYTNCTNVPNCAFSFSATGGATFILNYVMDGVNLSVSATGNGGGSQQVGIFGNHTTAYLSVGGGTSENILIVGNYTRVTLNGTGNQNYTVLMVGDHDNFTAFPQGTSSQINVQGWGTNLTVNAGGGSANTFHVYYTGFNWQPSAGICPVDNLAQKWDNVTSPANFKISGGPIGSAIFNDTKGPVGGPIIINAWQMVYQNPVSYACVFHQTFIASAVTGLVPASLVVAFQNRYAPYAEVALDQGAVVYAQSGAVPVMVDPPPVSFNPLTGLAKIWAPAFLNPVQTQSGTGTTVVTVSESTSASYVFPSGGWLLNPAKPVKLSYQSPYYTAWMGYFCSNPSFSGTATLSLTVGGVVQPSQNCPQYLAPGTGHFADVYSPYAAGGTLGVVTVTLPAKSLVLNVAEFTVSTG